MAISLAQHRALVTQKLIGTFNDATRPKMGLGSWFPSETTTTKAVSIEVKRNRKLAAVDVERGTDGNLNTFGRSTEKIYVPPFFKEFFNFSDLDVYDRTFGAGLAPVPADYRTMINGANEYLMTLRDKIEVAIEIQRSQALQTGIVTMKNGDNINYGRKADSIVDLGSGNYWGESGVEVIKTLEEGVKFCRQEGKSNARIYDVILGDAALVALRSDEKILKLLDIRNLNIGNIGTTMFNDVTGLSLQGGLTLKNAEVRLWTYDDFYELADGSNKEYIEANNIVMIPSDFKGKQAFAGVPAIMQDTQNGEFNEWVTKVASEFYVNNFVDQKKAAHIFQIYSAPLAVPFSIDRVYTAQVLANS